MAAGASSSYAGIYRYLGRARKVRQRWELDLAGPKRERVNLAPLEPGFGTFKVRAAEKSLYTGRERAFSRGFFFSRLSPIAIARLLWPGNATPEQIRFWLFRHTLGTFMRLTSGARAVRVGKICGWFLNAASGSCWVYWCGCEGSSSECLLYFSECVSGRGREYVKFDESKHDTDVLNLLQN